MTRLLPALCLLWACPEPVVEPPPPVCTTGEHDAFYEQRINPLLLADAPSTCSQCHLGGVDLSLFVRDDPCSSIACLRALDLIDLANPAASAVLGWIQRATPDSALITPELIAAEHEGFLGWITWNATCPEVCATAVCEPPSSPDVCPLVPVSEVVISHEDRPDDCSPRALEELFTRTVYPWRGRCYPCHFSNHRGPPDDAPRWLASGESCELDGLRTAHNLVEGDYLNLSAPDQSLILLKPLAEDAGGLVHGGHDKFQDTDDLMYRALHTWISRLAACEP